MKSFRAEAGRSGKGLRGALRRPRVFVALAVPLAVPVFLAAVRNQPEFGAINASAAVPAIQLRYDELRKPFRAELPEHALVLTVEQNDTLDGVLTAGGLSRGESALLSRDFGKTIDVRRLRPALLVRFHYEQTGVVDGVQMKVTGWGELTAIRKGSAFEVEARQAE